MTDIIRIKTMVANCQMFNQRKCEYCKRNKTCKEYQIVKENEKQTTETHK